MEIHRDSYIYKENENPPLGFSLVKDKQSMADAENHYPRTPLLDVKNKRRHRTAEIKSRKFSIDSLCARQETLSQLATDKPQEKDRISKSRKSCFAVFNVPEDDIAFESSTKSVTLPRAIEEEPETVTLQNPMLFGGISELRCVTETSRRSLMSKSDESLCETSKVVDSRKGSTAGITLPQWVEDEPDSLNLQSQLLSDVHEVSSLRHLKTKPRKSQWESSSSSEAQSCLHLGDVKKVNLGKELTVMLDEIGSRDKDSMECDLNVNKSHEQYHGSSDAASMGGFSCKINTTDNKMAVLTEASVRLSTKSWIETDFPVVSRVETETGLPVFSRVGADTYFPAVSRVETEIGLPAESSIEKETCLPAKSLVVTEADLPVMCFLETKENCAGISSIETEANVSATLIESKTSMLQELPPKQCAAYFSENTSASRSASEGVPVVPLDHQHSKASITNRECVLQPGITGQSLSTLMSPVIPHSPPEVENLQYHHHSSTPKSIPMPILQGVQATQLSTSFELINMSNSSLQEGLQKADLEGMIQSYLFLKPNTAKDLSAVTENPDKNQSNCCEFFPDQHCSDVLKSPEVNENVDVIEVHLGDDEVGQLETNQGECELKQDSGNSSGSFFNKCHVPYVKNELIEKGLEASHVKLNVVSMVMDACKGVNVSMVTDTCQVADVSMVTDTCQGIDISMVTDACQVVDVSLVTDSVGTLEHSVMVCPELQTQGTMTEKPGMTDTASSMTPLKLNKQGRRLTAEEIRRQHPRIVANQLDTLMACNQRLQKEVDTIVHSRDSLKSALVESKSKLALADKQLSEEKGRQGEVISVIEHHHHKTLEGFETSIQEKQSRIDSLETELKELKLKFEETQERWQSSSIELKEKCAQLEQFKAEADNNKDEEIRKLKVQFEASSYYHAFMASQQVIREMQAEQEEFAELYEDMDHSASLQSQLQGLLAPVINKSQKIVKDYICENEKLTNEMKAMQKKLISLQTDLEIALSENKDLHEDIQNINDILKRSNDNYTELETTYQAAKQELCQSKTLVTELNSKIEFGFKIVKELMTVKANLTDQLAEQQERNSLQSETLKSAELEIQNLTQQLEKERELMASNSDCYEQEIAQLKTSVSSLELCIEGLRNTLDSWEVDRDVQAEEVNDCHEQMAKQRLKMEEMSTELQSLRKIKAVTQPERDYYQEMRNTNKFLEAEKQLYMETLTDCRSRLEAEIELSASNNKLIDALRSNNAELQLSNDQLMSDLQMTEEVLFLKTMDLDMSCAAMENLQERMESILSSLQQQTFGREGKADSSTREAFFTPNKPSKSFSEDSSFVNQVLSAAKVHPVFSQQSIMGAQSASVTKDLSNYSIRTNETEKAKLRQSNVHFGAMKPRLAAETESFLSPHSQSLSVPSQNSRLLTDSKRPLLVASTSKVNMKTLDVSHHPQSSARKNLSSLYPATEQNMSTPGYAKICSIPSTVDRALEHMTRVRGENLKFVSMMNSSLDDVPPCLESDSMLAKVKLVDTLFSSILKAAEKAQRASDLTVKDLKDDITLLKEKLKSQRCQSKDLETNLLEKQGQLASARSQIEDLNARMREKTHQLMTLHDQQHQVMTLEEDKSELNRKVRSLREEVKLLSGQLQEMMQKFDEVKTGQKPEGVSLREIMCLKQKNHELLMKLFDERDKNKEVGEKAVRRMKILDANWRKAEQEVRKFDDLVEKIRETCIRSGEQSKNPVILQVVRFIDGVE